MARSKHSTALFEVINSRQPDRAAQSLRTPKWWFKSRPTRPSATPVEPPGLSQAPDPGTSAPPEVEPVALADSRSAFHFSLDRQRRQVTLQLRYPTAIASAFGLLVLIGLAYVLGHHLSHGPQAALGSEGPTSGQVNQASLQPAVTDVPRSRSSRSANSSNEQPARAANQNPQRGPAVQSLVPAAVETRLPRKVGLNYVVIQTYPPEEQQSAQTARDFLTNHGVPCTIETIDYARNKGWVCLVGTAGFSHISSPEYHAYTQNIVELGKQFPTSHFDRFTPQAYKWKGS